MGDDESVYEERITLWRASSITEAIDMAEAEAREFGEDFGAYLGLAQAYVMEGAPGNGAEMFSLMRVSAYEPHEYLNAFFDTGGERMSRS